VIALADTHTLRWWLDDPTKLSKTAKQFISNPANDLVISAVVPWELAIKTRLGKIDVQALLDIWENKLASEGFGELPIESADAIRAGLLPLHHRDPFDRMLVAQAHSTGYPIVSADRVFEAYGVRRIW
jgi:PIN domain nuclease of toxin-antitoxin system